MSSQQEHKKLLRKQLKERRDAMSLAEWTACNERLCEHLLEWLKDKNFRQFFLYAALGKEPDVCQAKVISSLLQRGQIGLPVVGNDGAMHFAAWDGVSPLAKNRYGIAEPTSGLTLTPDEGTVIFVPALSYTPGGHRLGFGKGYYDRFLAKHLFAIKIGICFNSLLSSEIPLEKHDVAVQHLLTD